jgi:error-prone DNA polymerase
VRGLGAKAGGRLKAALEMGCFASAAEVVTRAGVGEAGLRALAAAGAFRSLVEGGPRQALWTVLAELRSRTSGGPLAPPRASTAHLAEVDDASRTLLDHHATGFDLEGHPMRHLRQWLKGMDVQTIAELKRAGRRKGERVTTAGVVIVRQRPGTAKGFVFVGLEDETGRLDVIVSPSTYAGQRERINGHGILAVRGKLGVEDGVVNLKAERFFPLTLKDASEIVSSHDYH